MAAPSINHSSLLQREPLQRMPCGGACAGIRLRELSVCGVDFPCPDMFFFFPHCLLFFLFLSFFLFSLLLISLFFFLGSFFSWSSLVFSSFLFSFEIIVIGTHLIIRILSIMCRKRPPGQTTNVVRARHPNDRDVRRRIQKGIALGWRVHRCQ